MARSDKPGAFLTARPLMEHGVFLIRGRGLCGQLKPGRGLCAPCTPHQGVPPWTRCAKKLAASMLVLSARCVGERNKFSTGTMKTRKRWREKVNFLLAAFFLVFPDAKHPLGGVSPPCPCADNRNPKQHWHIARLKRLQFPILGPGAMPLAGWRGGASQRFPKQHRHKKAQKHLLLRCIPMKFICPPARIRRSP